MQEEGSVYHSPQMGGRLIFSADEETSSLGDTLGDTVLSEGEETEEERKLELLDQFAIPVKRLLLQTLCANGGFKQVLSIILVVEDRWLRSNFKIPISRDNAAGVKVWLTTGPQSHSVDIDKSNIVTQ
ncbi:unnamed protein product [Cylindrotheca closterium]|uniref:Uncharacterized protein n=1 Tax=Cylindrotheca closterium TaxID=2856 RepID=A0AAD2CL53_9STRA|nr:unnamed protein product [Cylindrotheca closterium]